MIDSISFQGKYIGRQTIKKLHKTQVPTEQSVVFAELSTNSMCDKNALKKVNHLWNDSLTNAGYVMEDFISFDGDSAKPNSWRKFFVLTLQKKKLHELKPEKMLGVAEVNVGSKNIKLRELVADPKNTHDAQSPVYKGIGSALMKAIKSYFPSSSIVINDAGEDAEFFIRQGFKHQAPNSSTLHFNADA